MRGPHPQPISTDARFLLSQDIVIPQRLIAVFESPTAIPVRGAENAQTPYWTGALCLLLCYSGLIQPPGESADLIRTIISASASGLYVMNDQPVGVCFVLSNDQGQNGQRRAPRQSPIRRPVPFPEPWHGRAR